MWNSCIRLREPGPGIEVHGTLYSPGHAWGVLRGKRLLLRESSWGTTQCPEARGSGTATCHGIRFRFPSLSLTAGLTLLAGVILKVGFHSLLTCICARRSTRCSSLVCWSTRWDPHTVFAHICHLHRMCSMCFVTPRDQNLSTLPCGLSTMRLYWPKRAWNVSSQCWSCPGCNACSLHVPSVAVLSLAWSSCIHTRFLLGSPGVCTCSAGASIVLTISVTCCIASTWGGIFLGCGDTWHCIGMTCHSDVATLSNS